MGKPSSKYLKPNSRASQSAEVQTFLANLKKAFGTGSKPDSSEALKNNKQKRQDVDVITDVIEMTRLYQNNKVGETLNNLLTEYVNVPLNELEDAEDFLQKVNTKYGRETNKAEPRNKVPKENKNITKMAKHYREHSEVYTILTDDISWKKQSIRPGVQQRHTRDEQPKSTRSQQPFTDIQRQAPDTHIHQSPLAYPNGRVSELIPDYVITQTSSPRTGSVARTGPMALGDPKIPCQNCQQLQDIGNQRYNELKSQNATLMDKVRQLENNQKTLQERLERSQQENQALKYKIENLEKSATKKLQLTSLSAEMEKKIGENEEDLENVSRPNRAMKIRDEFEYFCSNRWLDAKTELDDTCRHMTEKTKLFYLFILLQNAYTACENFKSDKLLPLARKAGTNNKALTTTLQAHQLQIPASGTSKALLMQTVPARPLPVLSISQASANDQATIVQELQTLRDNYTLTQEDLLDLRKAFQSGISQWLTRKDSSRILTAKEQNELMSLLSSPSSAKPRVQAYVEVALTMCWKMVTQMPPMTFVCEGVGQPYKGEQFQDIQWGSADPSDPKNVVLFYTQPTVKHGQHVMTKGKVFCGRGFFSGSDLHVTVL